MFRLGIIGRCLACQPWIHLKDLYHRQLKLKLQEQDNIALHVSLAGRSDLEPYERMKILHANKKLDGVLYHMRPFAEQKLLHPRRNPLGKLRYHLNPLLSQEKLPYDSADAMPVYLTMRRGEDLHLLPPSTPIKFLGIPLGRVNLWAGNLCGLNAKTIANEWIYFERLRSLCLELNIPLFFLGPIPSLDVLKAKKKLVSWEQVRKSMEHRLSKYDIPNFFLHPLLDKTIMPIYKGDRVHLNPEGHTFLARELYPTISPWIKSILATKP